MVPISAYLIVAMVLFGIGTIGVLISRNMIIIFMCVELMLNAANLALIAFSRTLGVMDGHAFVFQCCFQSCNGVGHTVHAFYANHAIRMFCQHLCGDQTEQNKTSYRQPYRIHVFGSLVVFL